MKLKKILTIITAFSVLLIGFSINSSAMKPSGMGPHTNYGRYPSAPSHRMFQPTFDYMHSASSIPLISAPFLVYSYPIEEAKAAAHSINPQKLFSEKVLSFLLESNPAAKNIIILTLNPEYITEEGRLAIDEQQVMIWYYNHCKRAPYNNPENILVFDLLKLSFINNDPLLTSPASPLRNHPFFLSCKYESTMRRQLTSGYNYRAVTFDYSIAPVPCLQSQFTMFTPIKL